MLPLVSSKDAIPANTSFCAEIGDVIVNVDDFRLLRNRMAKVAHLPQVRRWPGDARIRAVSKVSGGTSGMMDGEDLTISTFTGAVQGTPDYSLPVEHDTFFDIQHRNVLKFEFVAVFGIGALLSSVWAA